MKRGVTYYGTDGRGDMIAENGFELWEDEVGRVVQYGGAHLNVLHAFSYRKTYHVPIFRREMSRERGAFLAEWWVSSRRDKVGSIADPGLHETDFSTVIHHRPSDKMIAARLGGLDWAQLVGDLPESPLRHEMIVETVLPDRFFAVERVRRVDEDTWTLAAGAAADAVRALAGARPQGQKG